MLAAKFDAESAFAGGALSGLVFRLARLHGSSVVSRRQTEFYGKDLQGFMAAQIGTIESYKWVSELRDIGARGICIPVVETSGAREQH